MDHIRTYQHNPYTWRSGEDETIGMPVHLRPDFYDTTRYHRPSPRIAGQHGIPSINNFEQFMRHRGKSMESRTHIEQFESFNKGNTTNSKISTDIHKKMAEFYKHITTSIDEAKHIDTDDIKLKFESVIDVITKYNQDISSWYDDKFYSDKEKLYKSISMADETYDSFADSDFIICHGIN